MQAETGYGLVTVLGLQTYYLTMFLLLQQSSDFEEWSLHVATLMYPNQ